MHDDIRRFYLTGIISSDRFISARDSLVKELEDQMRDCGYVPILDLIPQFTREFDVETDNFNFELSIYGSYLGDNAWQVAGIMNGQVVKKYIHQTK